MSWNLKFTGPAKIVINAIGAAVWMTVTNVPTEKLFTVETVTLVVSAVLLALLNLLQQKPEIK